ncbi:MAG: FAD-binding protein [Raoultibacter sp.]
MQEPIMQNRRTFLKSAGITAAAAAAFTLAGCSSPGKSTTSNVSWEKEYDIIVVGAGIAGLAAAATVAKEGNGATCLLIEKEAAPNGNSPFCMGATLCSEKPDEFLTYLKNLSGGSTPDDVLEACAAGMAENYEWLISLGANEGDLVKSVMEVAEATEYPEFNIKGAASNAMFTGKAGGPKHVHTFLLDVVNQHSDVVTYLTSTPLEALVQDAATHAVLGVVAKGKNYRAKKGVIMCCGGFESDPNMLATYTGVRAYPLAGKANTGDGHRACQNAGADMWHMTSGAQYWMAVRDLNNTKHLSNQWFFNNKRWGITVGLNGRRFYQDWDGCAVPNPYDRQPYAMGGADLTLGVGFRHGITQFGGNWAHLPFPEKAWYIFDAQGLASGAIPPETSSDPVKDGWVYTANTLEELAGLIKVPVNELTHTVSVWNEFCDAGEDKAFYRPAAALVKVAEGPFYAALCVPTMLNTDGGPVRSAAGEILDVEGNPIAGLYSSGEFGSIWGHLYQGGGNVGECQAFGRISVRSALAREVKA